MRPYFSGNRPALSERAIVALLALLAVLAFHLGGCSRGPASLAFAAEPIENQIPGLIDVELRGFSSEHRALGALLGRVIEDEALSSGTLFGDKEFLVLEVDPAREAADLSLLRARTDVIFAEPVTRVQALWLPNDPDFKKQWHLKACGAPQAWDATRGEGITVAVLDTGITVFDDLDASRMVPGHDYVAGSKDVHDDNGHGTHVAGTIAQSTGNGLGVAGMAPEARLMPIKVLSAGGSGTSVDIADGIRWAADHGARVLNLSLGGGGRSEAMAEAVAYARDKGCVVVCAAGNSGARGVSFPAAYPGALAVSAVGPGGLSAPYTSYGPEVQLAGPGGDKTLSEEGGVLQQTLSEDDPGKPAYRWFQGTSMATPHVAGAAALLESVGVTNPGAVERLLTSTARPPGTYPAGSAEAAEEGALRVEKYGAGLLDAQSAVRHATLWWGLLRLALAALGAFFAVKHARHLGQLNASDKLTAPFVLGLVVASGALTMLAPLGLDRLPLLGILALPPAGMAARFLGLPGTSLVASTAGYLGWSPIAPLLLALAARGLAGARPIKTALGALAAGVAFGWAGQLALAAGTRSVHLPWLPAVAVPVFLGLSAVIAWSAGRGLFTREPLR